MSKSLEIDCLELIYHHRTSYERKSVEATIAVEDCKQLLVDEWNLKAQTFEASPNLDDTLSSAIQIFGLVFFCVLIILATRSFIK